MERISVVLTLVLSLLAASPAAEAQSGEKVARVGFLGFGAPPSDPDWKRNEIVYQAFSDLGWREGHNLSVEWRWAGYRFAILPDLATELVHLKVDVLIASGGFLPPMAATQATTSIPIVLLGCDPLLWIVESLARPGGNVTGQSCMSAELSPKRLQLLKEMAPRISRVAFVYNPDEPGGSLAWQLSRDAAPALGVQLLPVPIRRPEEVDNVLATISRQHVDGLFVYPNLVTIVPRIRARTVEFANREHLPAMYAFRWWVDEGGLVSYGTTVPDMVRRAVRQVDKILRGTKPAEIPVEQATEFKLVVNLKDAKALGLTIPPSVLARADEVIE